MDDFGFYPQTQAVATGAATSLFMWRGVEIVLIGERENERWVLARAWLEQDRLAHVRRWSFAAPIPFSGQVRRLVMDACGDAALARDEGLRALAWTESIA
jgi:hypothetical protein